MSGLPPLKSSVSQEADVDCSIPLSALQHYLFCPRQCALIHIEQAWEENRLTAEGRVLHEATSEIGAETRRGVRVVTAMPLASRRLGVSGIADLVELHAVKDGEPPASSREAVGQGKTASIGEVGGQGKKWRPFPVEYKRGKPKSHRADEVQLCAQAMALEEMFGTTLEEGALFYGEPRRRTPVALDTELRALTEEVAKNASAMIASGATPKPVYEKKKCGACSLFDLCRPKILERERSAAAWLAKAVMED